jgi:hypothetical protein
VGLTVGFFSWYQNSNDISALNVPLLAKALKKTLLFLLKLILNPKRIYK